MLPYVVYSAAFFGYAVAEWLRSLARIPYNPILYTFVAVAVMTFSVYRLLALRQRVRNLELGRDGERTVAEILDQLKARGCAVFHDILGADFNIDHVVIAPQGVYAVETKTIRKPPGAEISYKGDELVAGSLVIGKAPLVQAEAEARWLASILESVLTTRYEVKPVLLFVGWFVQPMPRSMKDRAWVLNPKALPSFIENEPVSLSIEDMKSIVFHLATYARVRAGRTA